MNIVFYTPSMQIIITLVLAVLILLNNDKFIKSQAMRGKYIYADD